MFDQMMSEEMWTLFETFSEKAAGPANIIELSIKAIPPVVKKIGLHSLSFKVDVPKDPVHSRNKFDYSVYDDGIEGKIQLCRVFNTNIRGTVEIYATADTQEAAEDFEKLSKLLFMLCGRVITLDTLENLLMTDVLTGAHNSIGFHKRAGMLCEKGRIDDYASFFTNIKNFKFVNQKIGMHNGDEILKMLVKRFRETFDEKENGIYRLGADNFVMLVTKELVPDLIQFLKTFDIVLPSGIVMHVYFKAGIFLADNSCDSNNVLDYAATAYAFAKTGRNGDFVFFNESMLKEELRSKSIMMTFPEALKKHEFHVYYQPKIRHCDSKLVGAEALCRWMKDGSIVPPLDFIPLIERFGSIVQLDLYVLEQVCTDIRGWIDSGIEPVRVSFNISRRDLAVPDLAEKICTIADKYSIPHELLEIELTETYISDEFTMMTKLISALSEKGFKISIDDFGSGYSTLTMLKNIRTDIIKLDRAFIKDMTAQSHSDKTIIKNVVNMVNELELEVIAEGVESREQVDFLGEVGCEIIQGFYYDKPLPKEEFDERLTDSEYYIKLEK